MIFSTALPTVMHVDINSCFATIEQQAHPHLRGKPVVVAAYAEDHGCILASSTEAKRLGIKTGMRVREAKMIERSLVVLPPDPQKYRFVNRQLRGLLSQYTPNLSVESIDEMVLNFLYTPALNGRIHTHNNDVLATMTDIAREIKHRICREIGEWITVSIGIAPNRYLAKVASGMRKPDGLVWLIRENIEEKFKTLALEDLCGIKEGNATRLKAVGITTPVAMLYASAKNLHYAFRSIVGHHWWMRLHGYEDGTLYKAFGSPDSEQKSFGQSHAMGKPRIPNDPRLWQILAQLVMKMGRRLRRDGFTARGISVSLLFADHTHWGVQHRGQTELFSDADFYTRLRMLLVQSPARPVRILAVSCFDLQRDLYRQASLFTEENRKETITRAIDAMQDRFGDFVVTSGRMLDMEQKVLDRIAFGRVRELVRGV